jgi:hypothetical protein
MKKSLSALDKIVDVVLSYRPKPKKKKKRVRNSKISLLHKITRNHP